MDQIETEDIFKGAYFLCRGGKLAKIRVEDDDYVTLTFRGEDLDQEDMSYRIESAIVSPQRLKENFELLTAQIATTKQHTDKEGSAEYVPQA
jgi:hypothetical protein